MALATPQTLDELASLMPFKVHAASQQIDFVAANHGLDFGRPFWHMTVDELNKRDKTDELDKVTLSFAELRDLVGTSQPQPAGMIFHIGRCGSTLVSRMVGHDSRMLVLREASPIGSLHRASSGSDRVPTFTIEQAFKDILVAFQQFAAARNQQIVVKHSSWESFSMARIAEVLPTTPMVFVYRNPIETVESSLDGHPGWAPRIHEPAELLERWMPWIRKVPLPHTAAAIYASVWASGAHAALSLPTDRVALVEHRDLTTYPERTIDRLQQHLSLDLDTTRALGELGQYSKAPTDGTTFNPDAEHGHPKLSLRTQAQVLDIVDDLPERLAARLAQSAS